LDLSSDKIGPKKHRFRAAKVNYILVVGEQEAAGNAVNVNDRDGNTIGTMPLENFVAAAKLEVETKGAKRLGTGN
jgi:threonyl-tRNA synthetase